MTPPPTRVLVADWTLDLSTGELLREGAVVPLQRRSFQVLAALVGSPGQLVTRDELCRLLWPDGTVVEFDNNLNSAVNKLRRALGDSAEAPRLIETLPGRGYRLLAAVSPLPPAGAGNDAGVVDATETPSPSPAIAAGKPASRWWKYAAAAVAATAILVSALIRSNERDVVVAVLTFDNVSGDRAQDHIGKALSDQLRARFGGSSDGIGVLVPAGNTTGGELASARHAGADFILTGSIRETADGLHVTALLVDGRNQRGRWGGTFTCPNYDLAAIEAQLAEKITGLVTSELTEAN
jgi:DNA-binding winged helix-turn-helix (wHTH) protein/TolB-like protein